MARGPGPGRGPRQKLGSGPKQGQRPGPKQGRGPGAGKGQKAGPGPGQGPGLGPGPGQGRKAGPRSEHGAAVPLRSRSEKKDNMKPKHPDEQEIPFRLRELMRSREALKRPDPGKKQVAEKKKQQQQKCQGPKAPGDIPVPRFRRRRGESERSYICRMEQEVQRVLFLAENQVQREPEKEATAPEKSKRKKE
ncbi:CC137 protein, partial [Pheucticus melanocephalus]|nr:CC137 protein [Pheucticus melanocephalus]